MERLTTAAYLALLMAAYAVAGHVDLREAERLEAEAYIDAHHEVTARVPDSVMEVYQLGLLKFPSLALPECNP